MKPTYYLLLLLIFIASCTRENEKQLPQSNDGNSKIISPTYLIIIPCWIDPGLATTTEGC